ncbi:MAG TPA: acyl-CoA dehydrogenase family protein [Mycobacteriales bacterium]|nr:acyl-CoA dehydrogenase family protein [Mycobacteriales bacterium]
MALSGTQPGPIELPVDPSAADLRAAVRSWVRDRVPEPWRNAAEQGGRSAIRQVRSRADYEKWYPVFAASGLVVPTWKLEYGGLGLSAELAKEAEALLRPYNLGRLNPLGLNNAAAPLLAHGTEAQRLRFLPPIVRNEEFWCQMFSEPGAGSDLASLATTAVLAGEEWSVTGQKVWTTWGFKADYAVLLARTDKTLPKRAGITFFLLDLHQPGVDIRPLRHISGEEDFCEVFLDNARIPDSMRVGVVNGGWSVAAATLAGERQMVAGSDSGGVGRIGGAGVGALIELAHRLSAQGRPGGWDDPQVRQELMRLYSDEQARAWTNQRVRAQLKTGRPVGPESSIAKVHQSLLNQRIQLMAVDMLGAYGAAWRSEAATYAESLPLEVKGMLRSRANTIEGGTTEVNKNILGERVLGLPREPDPWHGKPWSETPRS